MGEAKRRQADRQDGARWKALGSEPPPDDYWPMIVWGVVTCPCNQGARIVFAAARENGEWIVQAAGFNHTWDLRGWMKLPKPGLN